jgi:hypothetical protein
MEGLKRHRARIAVDEVRGHPERIDESEYI